MTQPKDQIKALLTTLGVPESVYADGNLAVTTPIDGSLIGHLQTHTTQQANTIIEQAHTAFLAWRNVPAPTRGELIRLF